MAWLPWLDDCRSDPAELLIVLMLTEVLHTVRALTVERETPEQDHARNRVGGLREASTRQVVVDKALGAEAREQALGDPLLEM